MQMDQGADVNHFQALLHNAGQDWYVTIYKSLGLSENGKVLDLGCGYGKLWRNNWEEIPAGVSVDGYDLRGSWAEDFAEFVEQHKETLPDGTEVYAYLLERYPEAKKYLTEQEAVLKEYFTMEIKEKGAFLLPKSTDFQHCYK